MLDWLKPPFPRQIHPQANHPGEIRYVPVTPQLPCFSERHHAGQPLPVLQHRPMSRAAQRPVFTHGVQSGDVNTNSGMIWTRVDRPSRINMEISTVESFKNSQSSCRR
jgi:hypothetical protein